MKRSIKPEEHYTSKPNALEQTTKTSAIKQRLLKPCPVSVHHLFLHR